MSPPTPGTRRQSYSEFFRAWGIGLVGGGLASWAGIPLAWMLGPLFAAMLISLAGISLSMPSPLRIGSRGMVGMLLGSAVTPETFDRVGQWPFSLMLMVLGLLLMSVLTASYYRGIGGFDRLSAVSASLPGAISNIPAIAIRMGANGPKVVLSHLARVTLVIMVVPPLYMAWQGLDASLEGGNPTSWNLLGEHLWILPVALPAGFLARRLSLPVPEMIGPMITAAILSLMGYRLALPEWLLAGTFLVLGTTIGARFYNMPLSLLVGTGRHALLGTLVTLATAVAVAVVMHAVLGVPLAVALLAVIPGGLAEMALLAAALGVDPVFVTFHQIARSILLNAMAPFVLRLLGGARSS